MALFISLDGRSSLGFLLSTAFCTSRLGTPVTNCTRSGCCRPDVVLEPPDRFAQKRSLAERHVL
jgi:hypothetical protein